MPCPGNSICIIVGEMSMVVSVLRRASRPWSHAHEEKEQDTLLKSFNTLAETINGRQSIDDLEPICYLSPFLDVIRSENTSGIVTGHGLSAVYKFLTYGLIDVKSSSAAVAAENIADAVTHARFMSVDALSDEVVLMKIIQVLRLLLLTPLGMLLTNESVCEIVQSFFRICFETRLSEILRRTAESALTDTVQLLFYRLPQFTEDLRSTSVRRLKTHFSTLDDGPYYKNSFHVAAKNADASKENSEESENQTCTASNEGDTNENNGVLALINDDDNKVGSETCPESSDVTELKENVNGIDTVLEESVPAEEVGEPLSSEIAETGKDLVNDISNNTVMDSETLKSVSYLTCMQPSGNDTEEHNVVVEDPRDHSSVQPLSDQPKDLSDDVKYEEEVQDGKNISVNPPDSNQVEQQVPESTCRPLTPYGFPCVRELFRLLISLINPRDRGNTEMTIQVGLSLLTISLESGADHIENFSSLLSLVKNEMCHNLFVLLSSEKLSVFAPSLRVFYLVFESLRTHLKFQLEMFLQTLMEVIASESSKVSYEQREMALNCIMQLWNIPGLVTELYINYDTGLYCSDIFEDITKLLSKNAFPLTGLYSVHLLSLDALLTIINNIKNHCHSRMMSEAKFCPEKEAVVGSDNEVKCTTTKCVLQETASGYLVGQKLSSSEIGKDLHSENVEQVNTNCRRLHNRMKISSNIPSHEELMAIKHKKKVLASGTEQFNVQPSKGITFLQEHGLLRKPLDPEEVARFLRDNPQLDKKMIGEYISNRKNLKILEAFVKSFSFENTRIDEALRQYLETFRLPGEAPLISLILEHFAEHWHNSNNKPFANNDAAFTLAYAVILLNVDQHNHNVKKQIIPMSLESFQKNLRNVNGGNDFDSELLESIYTSVRNEEIVMPAEQTGIVRENYQWKVLLRRGCTKEGEFIHAADGIFDHELFSLVWGPTVAALSFIFDKCNDSNIIHKIIKGFHKCALIAAHYGMSDVFDNLVISLCKFTSLSSAQENSKTLPVSFGNNVKAQIATKSVFRLAHCHGDLLREGWKNVIDCFLNLFKARLLPSDMVEAEDFVSPDGVVSLIREDVPRIPHPQNSGIFSSFYSYITSDVPSQRILSQEDEAAKQVAIKCIEQCHCDQLFTESKFLRTESLQELVKTLMYVCPTPDSSPGSLKLEFDEESSVFISEILIRILLLNRDRVASIWAGVQEHLRGLIFNAAAGENMFLLERSVVGVLRIAVRLVRKEEMIAQVMQSLQVLFMLKMNYLMAVSRQVACALHELLRSSAANIHAKEHWFIIFSIMERAGTGVKPQNRELKSEPSEVKKQHQTAREAAIAAAQSDSELNSVHHDHDSFERGYTSDSELYGSVSRNNYHHEDAKNNSHNSSESLSERDIEIQQTSHADKCDISLRQEFLPNDFAAFSKCCESLAFLVRDAAHITPENFELCVHCIRTFLERSAEGGHPTERKVRHKSSKEKKSNKSLKRKDDKGKRLFSYSQQVKGYEGYDADDDDEQCSEMSAAYQHASLQLLDLLHSLHTRVSSIFGSRESNQTAETCKVLWNSCWCPLLQGIAWLCCDARKPVRTSALTLLPQALLIPDLQLLGASEWEECFNKVLFPLLGRLLENISPDDPLGVEETRMRGVTLLCKVFLQHMTPLLNLPNFMPLWLMILDLMEKYMRVDHSGLLAEAIPESLKNMLLVMDTAGVFQKQSNKGFKSDRIWDITWDHLNTFLPGLKNDLLSSSNLSFMKTLSPVSEPANKSSEPSSEAPADSNSCNNSKEQEIPESAATPSVSITIPDEPESVPPTVILHPPVSPPVYTIASVAPVLTSSNLPTVISSPVSSPTTVPLLLNPSVMGDGTIHMFSTQV